MDSSVSPKDEIWFLRVCHHISNAVYHKIIQRDSVLLAYDTVSQDVCDVSIVNSVSTFKGLEVSREVENNSTTWLRKQRSWDLVGKSEDQQQTPTNQKRLTNEQAYVVNGDLHNLDRSPTWCTKFLFIYI